MPMFPPTSRKYDRGCASRASSIPRTWSHSQQPFLWMWDETTSLLGSWMFMENGSGVVVSTKTSSLVGRPCANPRQPSSWSECHEAIESASPEPATAEVVWMVSAASELGRTASHCISGGEQPNRPARTHRIHAAATVHHVGEFFPDRLGEARLGSAEGGGRRLDNKFFMVLCVVRLCLCCRCLLLLSLLFRCVLLLLRFLLSP
mmetsp:Transcript_518/g.574  ORF Transcript_518/g.574 Transcript_518/m.574 type:complete len:204 (+) Transcript_518:761-1372(+)